MNRSFTGNIKTIDVPTALEIFDTPQHRDIATIKPDGTIIINANTRKKYHTLIKLGRKAISEGLSPEKDTEIQKIINIAVQKLNEKPKADCNTCATLGDFIVPIHGTEFAIQDCKIPRVKDGKYHNKFNPKCMKNRRGECRDWKAR